MIEHSRSCSPHYPEKPEDEPAQLIVEISLAGLKSIRQCADCGAYEIVFRRPAVVKESPSGSKSL